MQGIEPGEKTFWKRRKSARKSQSPDARQQETEKESIHPESEKDISSHVSEAVRDHTSKALPSEVDSSVDSTPVHLDLSELCAEQSDQDLAFLRTYGLNKPDLNNSDDDDDSPRDCAYCMKQGKKADLRRCTGCRFTRYCSKTVK